ncbi:MULTISPECIES: ABC transporter ATP-binding protein [Oceanithermus]|uniref:ABC transporter ATP-binding protein n=2 Tax=Oceanithermus desulfurans TaxID=227924 RepID=A0A511RL27_9DEIN|nr:MULTISPECIES: ABC transporter ATP-binding protein [Oceanithermus]MBB6029958.1 ABC-2 type transport system ATP-binding protein [Oceanithermus desulfurans]GEM90373.1 ABC transporter ATP-binding protein [Oceanithermus desulfurans NBRC 100063]
MAVLVAEGLEKTFRSRGKTTRAVAGVHLRVERGEVLAFLGPNGAGKTTTIKMIAGLIRPDAGSVRVAGRDPHRDPWALRQLGAVLEGNRNVYWRLTPLENLEYFGVLKGLTAASARRRGRALLDRFELTHKQNALTQQLSRGMQQKLAIAVSLIHEPALLLLDEPTLGLDVEAAETVKQLIRELAGEGQAIVLTTHQLDVAQQLSHRVAIIREGRIVAEDRTATLLARFSGDQYEIEVEGELGEARRARLAELGAQPLNGRIVYVGSPEGLWAVLEALRPLPVLRVEKDRADLTEVFLKLVREEAHA